MFRGASAACTRWNKVGILPASFNVGITKANFSGCGLDVMTERNLCSSSLDGLQDAGVGSCKHLFRLDLACIREFPREGRLWGRAWVRSRLPRQRKLRQKSHRRHGIVI